MNHSENQEYHVGRYLLSVRLLRQVFTGLSAFFVFTLASLAWGNWPIEEDPFDEAWRWNKVEALSDLDLSSVSQSPDGTLWIGRSSGVSSYNGFVISEYGESEGFPRVTVNSIHAVSDECVYAVTASGLFWWNGGRWCEIMAGKFGKAIRQHAMVERHGVVWMSTNQGLLRADGGHVSVAMAGRFDSIALDALGRIWLSEQYSRRVRVLEITEEDSGWVRPLKRFIAAGETKRGKSPQVSLFASSDGYVWCVDDDPQNLHRRFDLNFEVSELPDLSEFGGNNIGVSIAESADGSIWVGGFHAVYRRVNEEWQILPSDAIAGFEVPYGTSILYPGNDDSFLIGGSRSSFYRIDLSDSVWKTYSGLNYQCEDSSGRLWFLSKEGQAVWTSPSEGEWTVYGAEHGMIDKAVNLFAASDGTLWSSGTHQGVAAVGRWTGEKWIHDLHPELGDGISHLSVFESRSGEMYFGCGDDSWDDQSFKGGIVVYRSTSAGYVFEYVHEPKVQRRVVGISEGAEGALWMGGLKLSKLENGKPEVIPVTEPNMVKWIDHLVADRQGRQWVAVWGEGLYEFHDGGRRMHTMENGLVRNGMSFVMESAFDPWSIWALGEAGASRFDGEVWTTRALPSSLGIDREGGNLKESSDGSLWLNQSSRDWNFRGILDLEESELFLPRFRSIRYRAERTAPLTEMVSQSMEYEEGASIRLNFIGRDFWSQTPSHQMEFSYRLDGGRWSPFSANSTIDIAGLSAGTRRIEARARDGDWNIDASPAIIEVSIVPVIWRQTWFVASALVVLVALGILVLYQVRSHVRHLAEMWRFKIWFLDRLSNDLRNPLASVVGPLESLANCDAKSTEARELIELARRSANRALSQVDQLLDVRNLELGVADVAMRAFDFVALTKSVLESHEQAAEANGVRLSFSCKRRKSWCRFDSNKLRAILDNLVAYALQRTQRGGYVRVLLEWGDGAVASGEDRKLAIIVEDDGPLIPKSERSKVLKPYYIRKYKAVGGDRGRGSGLALAGELLGLCGGSIQLESPATVTGSSNLGLRVVASLPVEQMESPARAQEALGANPEEPRQSAPPVADEALKPRILVVDGDEDYCLYLANVLTHAYDITLASNGYEALKKAESSVPDLIVSNIDLQKLDGYELCRSLKRKEYLSHIPVLLLSGDISEIVELDGMEAGAVGHLARSANPRLLQGKIGSLLASRSALMEKAQREAAVTPRDVHETSRDADYLERARGVVEKGLEDPDFSVERFQQAMRENRMTLYRKMKDLTGLSPKRFVNEIRKQKAGNLVKQEGITFSEIAQCIGILDISYFSRWFKREFGCSPSVYRSRSRALESRRGTLEP